MPTVYKVLGQSMPGSTAGTLATASVGTVVSSVVVCNQSATAATYRIAVRPAGATLAAVHYLVYDATVAPNKTDTWTIGISLGASDVLTVQSSSSSVSFTAFGVEIS